MPITLTLSEGLLTAEAQTRALAGLTEVLLDVAGLSGNSFMTPNVIGSIHILPKHQILAGGKPIDAAFIELKLPAIALATSEAKAAFIDRATTLVEQAADGRLKRDHIWASIVYAADGAWGIAGRAFNNDDLVLAIQDAAALQPA